MSFNNKNLIQESLWVRTFSVGSFHLILTLTARICFISLATDSVNQPGEKFSEINVILSTNHCVLFSLVITADCLHYSLYFIMVPKREIASNTHNALT